MSPLQQIEGDQGTKETKDDVALVAFVPSSTSICGGVRRR
jgi:hypothetical protein